MIRKLTLGLLSFCLVALAAYPVWAGPPRHVVTPAGYHGAVLHQEGCGCDSCYGAPACQPCCTPCCLHLIPKVVKGVGCLVHELFSCHRCYAPACGVGCDSGCAGCSDRGVERHEEVLAPSPAMSSHTRRSYNHWSMTPTAPRPSYSTEQAAGMRRPTTPAAAPRREPSVLKPKSAALSSPRIPAHTASATKPRDFVPPANLEVEPLSQVRPTSYVEPSRSIPHNPLRDN